MLGLAIGNSNNCGGPNANWWNISYPGSKLAAEFSKNRAMLNDSVAAFSDFLVIDRSSDGYCENSDGSLIKYIADEFRVSDRGILIESASSNLVLYSQDVTASQWSALGNASVSANNTPAPDNTTTADLISGMISADDGIEYTDGLSTNISGKTVTFSVYLKGNVSGQIEGRVETETGSGGSSSSLFSISTEWQRFTITHAFAADDADFILSLKRPSGGSVPQVYVWGVQLEEKSYATSYIATNGTTGNRAADDIYFHDLSWLDISAGTLLMDVQSDQGTLSNRRLLGFASAQGVETSPANNILENWNGLSLVATQSGNSLNWLTGSMIGAAWSNDNRSIVMNGGNIESDNSSIGDISQLYLGSRDGTNSFWEGYIRRLVYYTNKFSNSELQTNSVL